MFFCKHLQLKYKVFILNLMSLVIIFLAVWYKKKYPEIIMFREKDGKINVTNKMFYELFHVVWPSSLRFSSSDFMYICPL